MSHKYLSLGGHTYQILDAENNFNIFIPTHILRRPQYKRVSSIWKVHNITYRYVMSYNNILINLPPHIKFQILKQEKCAKCVLEN